LKKCEKKIKVNDDGAYICEYGYLHDYSKIKIDEIEKDVNCRSFKNVEELKKALEDEE
jgi:SOS-response transcriptional repressor LexA